VQTSVAESDFEDLQTALGHRFTRPELLIEALSHPSIKGDLDYNGLEFLGDRVLGLVIASDLRKKFPQGSAGDLALRFNALVRKESCTEAARAAGLGRYLIMSPGESHAGGADKPGILADVCEAIIGALYVDGGMKVASKFIHKFWATLVKEQTLVEKDSKSALQEWAHAQPLNLPSYTLVSQSGADHDPTFTVQVEIAEADVAPQNGEGPSRRAAEQNAAAAMLKAIGQ
jgi:ribonuclease-3